LHASTWVDEPPPRRGRRCAFLRGFSPHANFVELRACWGEERVFYRDRRGHLASPPARWTSAVPEDPAVATGAGRAAFRAQSLLELTALLADLQR